MKTFHFDIKFKTNLTDLEQISNILYGNGCNDALIGISNGIWEATFSRESFDITSAIGSALRDLSIVATDYLSIYFIEPVHPNDIEEKTENNGFGYM